MFSRFGKMLAEGNGENGNKSRKPSPKKPRESRNKNSKPDNFQWQKALRTFALWAIIFTAVIMMFRIFPSDQETETPINYTVFQRLVKNQQIDEILLIEKEAHGKLKQAQVFEINGKEVSFDRFKVNLPYEVTKDIIEEWEGFGIIIKVDNKDDDWINIMIQMLPWILLIVIWFVIMKRMQGGGTKGIFSFGKSRAKLMSEKDVKITFDDVAGVQEAKEELQEIVEFLKNPDKFTRLGGKIPKGALLLGQPGTGKTLLARAVAGEAGVPFFSISGADFVEMFVGVGASRVRDLFEKAKKSSPCIVFIDEIDAVGRHRGAGLGGGHDEREQTLNQLLVEMDGFEANEGIILIAATNRPDVLDSALMRPGRFDRQIVVSMPDVKGREKILRVHTRKVPLDSSVDLAKIAKGTPGFSGANLANLVNEAALLAARRNSNAIYNLDFENAKDKIMMGVERKSHIMSEKEKKAVAYHEAGHALAGKLQPLSDPVHKVTIIPRGRALGVTQYLPEDDRYMYSKEYMETQLVTLLAGRAAEKLIFDHLTTGASDDINRATQLARKMVCEWGMSDKIGSVTLGKQNDDVFLGREIAQHHKDYSEATAITIDEEIRRIVSTAENKANDLLNKSIETLHTMAEALITRETLDSHEVGKIMKGEKLADKLPDEASKQAAETENESGDKKEDKKAEKDPETAEKKAEPVVSDGQK